MTVLVAAVEPTHWGLVIGGAIAGALLVLTGVRTWQGRYPGPTGPRPPYQTYFGAAHACVPMGGALILFALGELIRGVLGLGRHGAFYWSVSIVVAGVWAVSCLYVLAYFWIGVPPPLRPPYQRDQLSPDHGRPKWRDRIRGRP